MKKRLSKILWYGGELPNPATSSEDLEGLHEGELFLHLKEDGVTLWSLSADGRVVEVSGGGYGDLSQYLLKSIWDRVWEIKTDSQGNEYIFGKLPVVTQYGITMYADGGDMNIPSIYDGLPIDGNTLIRDENGVLMLNPNIELGGGGLDEEELKAFLSSENYAKKSDIPSLNGYATESWVTGKNYVNATTLSSELAKYVPTNGDTDILGLKNFTKGLQIDGLRITKSQDDVIYLDANLVVRGGITMYAEGSVDVGTIYDGLPIDGTTIYWDDVDGSKVLKANITEGVITNITSDMVVEALGYTPLQNHQTIYALTIQKNGTNVGTYTPNSAKKTINIVVPTKVSDLENDEEYATTSDLDSRINDLINGAPAAFDTLKEIADVLSDNVDSIGDIITTLGTKADKSINISAGTGLSGGGTLEADRTLSLATSGVTAGTYKSVTVDKYGRVTSGTNPTTLAGYGITDAYTKSAVDALLGGYVTLATKQTITGEKNFTGGLKVNGSPIVYDAVNKYWKLEGDLLVTGGITMFGSDSDFKPYTIMDGVVVDGVTIRKNPTSGALEFIGSINGGIASSVDWENVENKPSWIGSSKPVYSWNEITSKPTFATVATSGKYSDLSGTPTFYTLTFSSGTFSSGSFVANSADKTINIPTTTSHISEGTNLYFTNARAQSAITGGASTIASSNLTASRALISNSSGKVAVSAVTSTELGYLDGVTSAIQTQLNAKLASSSYTASDVLTKLKTVDGSDSGLDADLLDGTHKSDLLTAASSSSATNLSITVGGSTKNITDLYAYKATQLETARTIWGQSFDGSEDVTGNLTVGDGNIYLNNNKNISVYNTNSVLIDILRLDSINNLLIGKGAAIKGYNTYLDGNNVIFRYGTSITTGMILNSSGNVSIGTSGSVNTNRGYRLDVLGNMRVGDDVTFDTKLTLNGIPIYKSQDDVLYIDGNLAVRGGITMYATDAIDVPSIIDALPSATYGTKGMAAFNPNDFSVVDGYVSFIGKGGVDESVLANYAKKVDLNAYLPLSGGQMTGGIGYTLTPDSYNVGLPSAGLLDYTGSLTTYGVLSGRRTYIGSVYNTSSGYFDNVISIRHRNGIGDGDSYGMYINTNMTINSDSLKWNRQINGTWQGERVILDSMNWSQYVTAADGGNYLPVSGGNITGSLQINGNVGIGTTNKSANLHVSGDTISNYYIGPTPSGGQYPRYRLIFDQNSNSTWLQSANHNGTSAAGNITLSGMYGADLALCKVLGSLLTTGGITMYSDVRKKTILNHVELSLQQVANAPLIEHYYNSDQAKATHVGSIAQYWASMNDWFCKLDSEGYYTMEIQNAALASAISIARELVKYESKTDKKIRLLKKRIGELEDKIEELEKKGV